VNIWTSCTYLASSLRLAARVDSEVRSLIEDEGQRAEAI